MVACIVNARGQYFVVEIYSAKVQIEQTFRSYVGRAACSDSRRSHLEDDEVDLIYIRIFTTFYPRSINQTIQIPDQYRENAFCNWKFVGEVQEGIRRR